MIHPTDIIRHLRLPLAGAGAGLLFGQFIFSLAILSPRVTVWSPWAALPLTLLIVAALSFTAIFIWLWKHSKPFGAVTIFLSAVIIAVLLPKLWSGFPFDLIGFWRKLLLVQGIVGSLIAAAVFFSRRRHILPFIASAGCALLIESAWMFLLLSPGESRKTPLSSSYMAQFETRDSAVNHPAQPCGFSVADYGPEGDEGVTAPWHTGKVDGSFLRLTSSPSDAAARHAELGFRPDSVPLRGVAYIPALPGKLPLAVFIHGSHPEHEPVYKGYGYLCKALAERGYIAVSVDENFLNDRWSGTITSGEMEARGWVLLKNLEQLRLWNSMPGHPLAGRVDLDNITLVGHSRGGRGVTLAALFNRMPFYPLDPTEKFDFGFNIRSVVEIAPWDGFLFDGWHPAQLRNVNYLALIAGHDTDVYLASGLQTYNNVRFDDGEPHFKQIVYLYGATHAGFNTLCATDLPFPWSLFSRRADFAGTTDQQAATRSLLLNFMEASARHETSAVEAVRDYRLLGKSLPEDYYLSLSSFSDDIILAGYEEDFDITSGSFPGTRIRFTHPQGLREEMLFLRDSENTPQDNRVLHVNSSSVAEYEVILPESDSNAPEGLKWLAIDVYNFMDETADFLIEVTYPDGSKHESSLRDQFILPPLLRTFPQKGFLSTLTFSRDHEAMGQTVRFPLPCPNLPASLKFRFPANTDIAIDNISLVRH